MTTLLSQAIQEAEKLSEEAQNKVAEHVLQEVHTILADSASEDETAYLMRSPANQAVLLRRIAEIERGENLVIPDQSQFE